ncbi:Mur ligase [Umbelopsis sp. AD052]|nr:Mur ligase [Umbelopsis sp. AD052]
MTVSTKEPCKLEIFSMDLGLDRIKSLLYALGSPEKNLLVIHVAGTNGKGSVCAYIASILKAAGFKVGRYNSPHFLEPTDAMQICDESIDSAAYRELCDRVASVDKENNCGASTFELSTAAAILWFYESKVDFAVIEVGLGGTLDATNVFDDVVASVITPIGMDHAGILGNSIAEIASAKAGIIKANCPVIASPQPEADAMDVVKKTAQRLSSPLLISPMARWCSPSKEQATVDIRYPNDRPLTTYQFKIPLYGDHQLVNAATAVSTIHILKNAQNDLDIKITVEHIQQGMADTRWPGRLDLLTKEQCPWLTNLYSIDEMFVDGAHNPPAAKVLREFVDQQCQTRNNDKVQWIIASTEGKDVKELLSILLRPQDSVCATTFTQPENMPWISHMDPSEIRDIAATVASGPCTVEPSLAQALRNAGQSKGLIVLCGSLYLVADLYRLHRHI